MKPVKLIIEGIKSYTEAQELDFEAAGRNDLFCIVGKTGAGKSTVFDCIMLALYGRIGKSNLADVVNLSKMNARVKFDFTELGDMYSVERTIKCRYEKNSEGKRTEKRNHISENTLYKNGVPVAKGEEATAMLREIVGLDENEFKNVYLLEQGEYADFLKKTPGQQTEAVGKIFDLMRFGDITKLAGEYKRREEELARSAERRLADFGDVSPEKLKEQRSALTALKAKNTSLIKEAERRRGDIAELEKQRDAFISAREKQNAVQKLTVDAADARLARDEAVAAAEKFESAADTGIGARLAERRDALNALSALNSLDREYVLARRTATEKAELYEKSSAEAADAQSRYDALVAAAKDDEKTYAGAVAEFLCSADSVKGKSAALIAATEKADSGVTEAIFALAAEKRAYTERAEAIKKYSAAALERKKAAERFLDIIKRFTDELGVLNENRRRAAEELSAAEKSLSAARLRSNAAAVRAELNEGDVCPVCGGRYCGGIQAGDTDVERAKSVRDRAAAAEKEIADRLSECEKRLDRAKSDYEREAAARRDAEAEKEKAESEQAACKYDPQTYAPLEAMLERIKAAEDKKRASAFKAAGAEPELARLRAKADAALAAKTDSIKRSDELKAALGDRCGKTDGEISAVKAEIRELEDKESAVQNERKRLGAAVAAANAALDALNRSLEQARADCPVDLPPFDEQDYADKRAGYDALGKTIIENEKDIAAGEESVKHLAESCERLKSVAAEKKMYDERADVYGVIADMTKGKAMLNYVAAEYIAEFTATASDILSDMSSGKYSLSYDQTNGFMIADYLNGGKRRKTETLSGGELFLASLAVAIAIARTQSKGNNAFFFLDEGFGTLDGELLDVVYSALEMLSRDCLVGVITHSPSLIDRMPFCVEIIEASDDKGSVIKY